MSRLPRQQRLAPLHATLRLLASVAVCTCTTACDRRPSLATAEQLGATAVSMPIPPCAIAERPPLRVDVVASGLEVPWDVVFLADGRTLVTERPGRIRLLDADGQLRPEPWATLDVFGPPGREVGLLGIDARPAGASLEVYVAAAFQRRAGNVAARTVQSAFRTLERAIDANRGHEITLQVIRLLDRDGRGVEPQVIVADLPSEDLHGGGGLRLGPDAHLYTANGDGGDPLRAQAPASLRGKLLRYATTGSKPAGPAAPDSPVVASGVRHVQGLDWLPSGELVFIDHGPTGLEAEGGRTDHDELNVLSRPGTNFGWPIVSGGTRGGPFVSPIAEWTPAIAPAGLAVYRGSSLAWADSVFVTGLRGGLRRIVLAHSGSSISASCEEVVIPPDTYGRLRLVRTAPDGTLWVGTSNRDGRGRAGAADDRLLRLHPPDATSAPRAAADRTGQRGSARAGGPARRGGLEEVL